MFSIIFYSDLKEKVKIYKDFRRDEEGKDFYNEFDLVGFSKVSVEFSQGVFLARTSTASLYYPILVELKENGIAFNVAGKPSHSEFSQSQGVSVDAEFDETEEKGEETTEDEIFPVLQAKDIEQAGKMKESLKAKTLEEKKDYLFRVLKIKKHPGPSLARQSYCPVYECNDKFNNNKNLRQHIIKKHPKLSEYGVELRENGELIWPETLIDYSLLLSKLYPAYVKRIINMSKKIEKGR